MEIRNSDELAKEFLARFKGKLALSYGAALLIGFGVGALFF